MQLIVDVMIAKIGEANTIDDKNMKIFLEMARVLKSENETDEHKESAYEIMLSIFKKYSK